MDMKKVVEVGAIILGGIFLYELLSSASTAAQTTATTQANDQAATTQAQIAGQEDVAYANDGASVLGSLLSPNSPLGSAIFGGSSPSSFTAPDLSSVLAPQDITAPSINLAPLDLSSGLGDTVDTGSLVNNLDGSLSGLSF